MHLPKKLHLPLLQLIGLLTLLSLGQTSRAEECLERVWQGTIGTAPVTIEFGPYGPDNQIAGHYYYRTSLSDLFLLRDETKEGLWQETDRNGTKTGAVTLNCVEQKLSGTWVSPNGEVTLPIKAQSSRSQYSEHRLEMVKPKIKNRVSIGNNKYEILVVPSYESVEGLRLIGNEQGVIKINKILFKSFLDRLDSHLGCQALGRLNRGIKHDYEENSQQGVSTWNRKYVVISENSEGYCGGAHPYGGMEASTFNILSGELETVSTWLDKEDRKKISPETGLGKLLIKKYRQKRGEEEPECLESVEFWTSSIWPTSTGLIFQTSFPYSLSSCSENVLISFNLLMPYLTEYGKKQVQIFQSK
jgi:hypothetical protein